MSRLFRALQQRAAGAGTAPLVTWYGAGGARAELSAVTFATSVAKTAGLLVDELEAQPGDRVRLDLPLHWQVPVWLAACDVAGLVVSWPGDPAAEPAEPAVTVVAHPSAADPSLAATGPGTGTIVVVSPATAFGQPQQPVPPPLVDHFSAALGQPDAYAGPIRAGSWVVAGGAWDGARIEAEAAALARGRDLPPGGRVLVGSGSDPITVALASWALPLVTGGSVVLVQHGDVRAIAVTERVDASLAPGQVAYKP